MKLALPAVILGLLVLAGCARSSEQSIRGTIAAANYCESAEDCVVVPGVCPFDCYVLTNRSQSGAIAAMLKDYPTTCMYSCIEQPPYRCENKKCVFDQ